MENSGGTATENKLKTNRSAPRAAKTTSNSSFQLLRERTQDLLREIYAILRLDIVDFTVLHIPLLLLIWVIRSNCQ